LARFEEISDRHYTAKALPDRRTARYRASRNLLTIDTVVVTYVRASTFGIPVLVDYDAAVCHGNFKQGVHVCGIIRAYK
jgi:hypothetical protein